MGPVAIDPCQAEVDRLNEAQQAVAGINAEIEALQSELSTASPGDKPGILKEIRRLRQQDLREAMAALDEARRALQACRS